MSKITAFLFTHGHMDIEWYQPLHSYRFWLIEALQRQIRQCADDPDAVSYTVDGQMFPIEEFLEACPGATEDIARLARQGKLNIGPFYTQFDEWLPSGEAMVRNCLRGDRAAKHFGAPMKVGYLPDNFGHPLQLPQILAGFGIDSLLFMRGMPYVTEDFPDEFRYRGVDGSELMAVNFRSTYAHIFTRQSGDFYLEPRDTPYYKGTLSYESYMNLTVVDDPQAFAEAMILHVRSTAKDYRSGIVPVVLGSDHAPPHVHLAEAVRAANGMQNDIEFVAGSPEEYVDRLRAHRGEMPTLSQELIGTRFQYILLGALSTRSYLKRANFAAEALLEKYAEPLEAIASLNGGRADAASQLEEAWRLLLINHAHDSIHGSSTDEVHEEMVARYNVIRQIGAGVAHNALADIGRRTPRWWGPGDTGILAYAPVPGAACPVADVWLPVGSGDVSVVAADGSACPLQVLRRPDPTVNDIGLETTEPTPPRGIEQVLIRLPKSSGFCTVAMTAGARPASENPLKTGPDFIENEHLKICAADALLNILDKAEGAWYYGQNLLCETAEAGDYWDTSPTWIPSETVLSNRFGQTVEITEAGPVRATMKVSTFMSVPACLEDGRRSRRRVDLPVEYTVSLVAGARRADVSLRIDNTARDHKITLLVDPQLASADILSQNAFCTLRRPVARQAPAGPCVQPPTAIFPFREWLAIADCRRGLAVACRGVYDYEPRTDGITGHAGVSLTLLRSVGNMSRKNTKMRAGMAAWSFDFPGGQCLGPQVIEYSFVPYSVNDGMAFLGEVNGFLYPALGHVLRSPAEADAGVGMPFAWEARNVVFSAFKRAADGRGTILRLFENEGKRTELALSLKGFRRARLCSLDETPGCDVEIRDSRATVLFDPYKIVTLLLEGD